MNYNLKITVTTTLGEFTGNIAKDFDPSREDMANTRDWLQRTALSHLVLHTVNSCGVAQEIALKGTILDGIALTTEIIEEPANV